MNFGYGSAIGGLKKKGLIVAVGVVALPLSLQLHTRPASISTPTLVPPKPVDPRVMRLGHFLRSLDCPIAELADDFIKVADKNHLDWRLLPSIAIIESGGGKAYKNNNIFGWNGGEQSFNTIRSGMEVVASRLASSPLYRRRNSLEKLRVYNEDQDYADSVLAVMNRISPRTELRPVSRGFERGASVDWKINRN